VPPSATSTDPAQPLRADERAALVAAVQRNCDLADAHHADGRSLCTYLLGMREYFRWEARLPPGTAPDRQRLSAWIAEREGRWEALREQAGAFVPLPLDDGFDAFDEASVNHRLTGSGLVYGAGVGLFGAPLFFLAEARSEQERDGVRVIVAGEEFARSIVAPPAASRDGAVTVRLDALRRWLFTRFEAARRGPADTAFMAALRAYGDPADAATVARMAEGEAETLVLHELGEQQAGEQLGAEWKAMLAGIADRRTELAVRAVRDLLADCLVTLPTLAERQALASLNFWRSSFDGLRRELAPELMSAFGAPAPDIDLVQLDRSARTGRARWRATAEALLSSWRRGGPAALQSHATSLSGQG
jgi:hypothetical protein